jgi:hypothetical protein
MTTLSKIPTKGNTAMQSILFWLAAMGIFLPFIGGLFYLLLFVWGVW